MRLYTFLALCACALYVRAATIPADKKLDALDDVDLDNVEPEPVVQPAVVDLDNNLRKTPDIPVDIVQEPVVLDETSNDYVPDEKDNIVIKRIEIDINNPGPPQRQEHETQNPENFGENERAVFAILQKAGEAQNIFTKGLKIVSNSFETINGPNEDLPAIQQKLKNLKDTFTTEIEQLNVTIRNNLKPEYIESNGEKKTNSKLELVNKRLQNLEMNFKVGIDTLNEGVELLSIIREEDQAAKTKAIIDDKNEAPKADTDNAASGSSPAVPATSPGNQNVIQQMVTNFQNGVNEIFGNFTQVFQNQNSDQGSTGSSNFLINLWQGINLPSFLQGQNSGQAPAAGAQAPVESDTPVAAPAPAPAPAPTPAPAQWGPQAFLQSVQNTFQSIINPGQANQQVQQDTPQPVAPPRPIGGPIAQAIQNIVQFIQRPGQTQVPQQPQPPQPSPNAEKVPESQNVPPKQPESAPPAQEASPAEPIKPVPVPTPDTAAETPAAPQAAPAQDPIPVQPGPIQQLVENNPVIKGIQTAVQRVQYPNGETPREEVIDEKKETKGHRPGNNVNQGDINDSSGIEDKIEEVKENIPVAKAEAEVTSGVKPEVTKIPELADKTE